MRSLFKTLTNKTYVIEKDGQFINILPLKSEKENCLYYGEGKQFPKEDAQEVYLDGKKCYLLVALPESELDHLRASQKLFRNKFFKSLLKDRFSFSEWMVLIVGVITIVVNYYMYTQLQAFWQYVGVA